MQINFNVGTGAQGAQVGRIGGHQLGEKGKRVFGVLFAVIGVVLLAVAAIIFFSPGVPEEFTGTTRATITQIESYNQIVNNKTETKHRVFIEYTVEGRKYETQLNTYNSSMRQGGPVTINYDTRDPGVVFTPGAKTIAAIIVGFLGIVFFIVGIVVRMRARDAGAVADAAK